MAQLPAIEIRARANQPLGMSPARFLRDYWQKRPLLIRGAYADFENPVAPDDLAGLACEELALARIVIEEKKHTRLRGNDGNDPRHAAESRWTVRSGPFAEADFATLPKTHWTLLVQDVDKWDADAARLLDRFAFLPGWRIDDVMASYAEDGGSVGAHVDQYDVFLLQGLGRRRWRISTDPSAPHDFRDDTELKLLREFAPTDEWTLETGDLLYLPPGIPHHGVALGACMTWSIGMRAPSQAELLVDFAETFAEAMPDSLRLGDADLAPAHGEGEIDDAAIARVRHAMPWLRLSNRERAGGARARNDPARFDGVDAVALRLWFGRFITRYRSMQIAASGGPALTDAAFARACAANATVRRNPWSRFAWLRHARGAVLFVAGEAFACSLSLARLLGARREFLLAEVGTAARDREVLRTLINAGHLLLERARRGRKKP